MPRYNNFSFLVVAQIIIGLDFKCLPRIYKGLVQTRLHVIKEMTIFELSLYLKLMENLILNAYLN